MQLILDFFPPGAVNGELCVLVSSANVSEVIALSSFEYDAAAAAAAAARPNMALCSLKRRDCFNLPLCNW